MTRELKFDTSSLGYLSQDEDCILSPDDPIHALKAQAFLGTLTPEAVSAAYKNNQLQKAANTHFEQLNIAKQMNIKPGSPAWYALTQ